MSAPLGVGILGAGPVTQAIHLPTLSTLGDRFRVVHVMDVDARVASTVAARTGARTSTDLEPLLDDPAVDVVAVCSPHHLHADQVAAAAAAGKRGILCEKPLTTTMGEAQRIADLAASSRIPVVVGAMHVHDPAWTAARQHHGEHLIPASLIRSVIYLPPNDEFVGLATDPTTAPDPPAPAPASPAEARARKLRGGILGLATHAIPLVRQFTPTITRLHQARPLDPFGYQIVLTAEGGTTVELLALTSGRWRNDWTFHAWGPGGELHVDFPPSYVLAGSATAHLHRPGGTRRWRYPTNGYQAEWSHLSDVVQGRAELSVSVHDAVADLRFALDLADRSEQLLLEHP